MSVHVVRRTMFQPHNPRLPRNLRTGLPATASSHEPSALSSIPPLFRRIPAMDLAILPHLVYLNNPPDSGNNRRVLEHKERYGLKRWEIGEIASKIGQLYYHYYLRTSETNYLRESAVFYQASQPPAGLSAHTHAHQPAICACQYVCPAVCTQACTSVPRVHLCM